MTTMLNENECLDRDALHSEDVEIGSEQLKKL